MQPTLQDVHVNVPLTMLSLMYMQSADAFVADRMFPTVTVNHKSDSYWKFDRSDFNRNQMAKRAPSTESAGGGYKVDSSGTYVAEVWSLHKDIDDQIRANSDAALRPDMNATRWLTMQAMISKEVAWAAAFFAASIFAASAPDSSIPRIAWRAASPPPDQRSPTALIASSSRFPSAA
jgi:hypothetical protein